MQSKYRNGGRPIPAPSPPAPVITGHERQLTFERRFHNAQTINLSVVLGLATAYYAWRKPATAQLRREYMKIAAFVGSIYWLAGVVAILHPGTMGLDPEFGGPGFPQAPLFVVFSLCALFGSYLEA